MTRSQEDRMYRQKLKEKYPVVKYTDRHGATRTGFLERTIKHGQLKGRHIILDTYGLRHKVQIVETISV